MLRNPTTFSFQDISSWKSDVTNLPIQIAQSVAKLSTLADEHSHLTAQKDELTQNSINPQQERVNAIQWKLAILENPGKIVVVKSQIAGYVKELSTQYGTAQELGTRLSILRDKVAAYEAAEKLTRCRIEDTALRSKLSRLSDEVAQHSQRQLALTAGLHLLNTRMEAATCELNRLSAVPAGGYSSTQTSPGGYTSNQHPNHAQILAIKATIDALHNQIHSNEAEACHNADCARSLQADIRSTEYKLAENHATESSLESQLSRVNFTIPVSLSSICATLMEERRALSKLEGEERRLKGEISNNEQQKNDLAIKSDRLSYEYDKSLSLLDAFIAKEPTGQLQHILTDDHYTLANVDDLKTLHSKENDILRRYTSSRDQLYANIKTNLQRQDAENRSKAKNESALQRRREDTFMSDFNGDDTNKIKAILDNLSQKLINALQQYNKDHPRIDDAHIRGRLREYASRVDFIRLNNRQFNDNAQDLRQRIVNLSGYIWTLNDNINDKTFKQIVLDVLDKGAISQVDSTKQFAALRDDNQAQLYRITPEHLKASEAEEYRLAYKNLKDTLDNQPKNSEYYVRYLFSTGKNLLDIVNDNNSSYDHSTKILNAARELILDFKSPANHQNLANLLKENEHGKRSTAKVVSGAILMVLGAAGFAVCLTLGILSLGILSAPAAIGMVSSVAVFGLGATLCINGRNKGVHKAIMNFQWAAEKSDDKYATSPLSKHSYFQTPPSAPPLEASAPVFSK